VWGNKIKIKKKESCFQARREKKNNSHGTAEA